MTLSQFILSFCVGAITSIIINFIITICDKRQHKKLMTMLQEANDLADKCIVLAVEKKLNEQPFTGAVIIEPTGEVTPLNNAALAQEKSPESFSGDVTSNSHAANEQQNATEL